MKRILTILLILTVTLLYAEENIVTASIGDLVPTIQAGEETDISILLNIKESWHINSSKVLDDYSIPTKISLENNDQFALRNIQYPQGKETPISWGGNMSLYEGEILVKAKLFAKNNIKEGERALEIKVTYQACNNLTCMSPESITLIKNITVLAKTDASVPQEATSEIKQNGNMNESKIIDKLNENEIDESNPFQNRSLFVVLLLVFIMGLALNLTPCVYPLIPITMGYFLAQKDSKSPVLLAIMYVLGLSITYSIIGTLAAFGGSMMGALLANPITLIFFAALMLALSLSMFGLYEFKLPNALTQVSGGSRAGAVGALIMGLTMGIVAAPCVGPFVVSLLTFVAQSGSIFIGFITFFVLALGLGVPYLFLGIFSSKISNLPRSGEWLNGIRMFFGLALIGMSIYFILPLLSGPVADLILPVYMIIAAIYYGVIDKAGLSVAWFSRLKVILAMLILAAGILMIKPDAQLGQDISWDKYTSKTLDISISEQEPVIIDFYADWCNPCKELEHITFMDPEVQEALKNFIRLKVDLTVVNDSTNALKNEFNIPGVPTIIFYDKTGQERKDLRLNGFEKPKKFVERLRAVLSEE